MSIPASNILSSAFSLNMLPTSMGTQINAHPVSAEEAAEIIGAFENSWEQEFINCVNPRHESTAALVAHLTAKACEGGFASVRDGDHLVAILPPRELANRSGAEIEVSDLDECQFWHLSFKQLD